jgi:hypothetical protein
MDLKEALGVARLNLAMTRGIEYSHQQREYVAVDGTPQAVEAARAYNVLASAHLEDSSEGITCEVAGVTYRSAPVSGRVRGNLCEGCAGESNSLCLQLGGCAGIIWIARTPPRRFCDCR